MVERLFLAVPRGCLRFVIVVFPDHTNLLFLNLRIHGLSSGKKLFPYFYIQFAPSQFYLWSWFDYFQLESIETKKNCGIRRIVVDGKTRVPRIVATFYVIDAYFMTDTRKINETLFFLALRFISINN